MGEMDLTQGFEDKGLESDSQVSFLLNRKFTKGSSFAPWRLSMRLYTIHDKTDLLSPPLLPSLPRHCAVKVRRQD